MRREPSGRRPDRSAKAVGFGLVLRDAAGDSAPRRGIPETRARSRPHRESAAVIRAAHQVRIAVAVQVQERPVLERRPGVARKISSEHSQTDAAVDVPRPGAARAELPEPSGRSRVEAARDTVIGVAAVAARMHAIAADPGRKRALLGDRTALFIEAGVGQGADFAYPCFGRHRRLLGAVARDRDAALRVAVRAHGREIQRRGDHVSWRLRRRPGQQRLVPAVVACPDAVEPAAGSASEDLGRRRLPVVRWRSGSGFRFFTLRKQVRRVRDQVLRRVVPLRVERVNVHAAQDCAARGDIERGDEEQPRRIAGGGGARARRSEGLLDRAFGQERVRNRKDRGLPVDDRAVEPRPRAQPSRRPRGSRGGAFIRAQVLPQAPYAGRVVVSVERELLDVTAVAEERIVESCALVGSQVPARRSEGVEQGGDGRGRGGKRGSLIGVERHDPQGSRRVPRQPVEQARIALGPAVDKDQQALPVAVAQGVHEAPSIAFGHVAGCEQVPFGRGCACKERVVDFAVERLYAVRGDHLAVHHSLGKRPCVDGVGELHEQRGPAGNAARALHTAIDERHAHSAGCSPRHGRRNRGLAACVFAPHAPGA